MDRERNTECWYNEVCRMNNSCESCIRYAEMKYLMDNSGIPPAKQRTIILSPDASDLSAFEELQAIKDDIENFVSNGENLYICGDTGTGKTSWAIKILLKYFNEIWAGNGFRVRGLFVHIPSLLLKLKDFDHPLPVEYKQSLLDADLIVWDELGGSLSDYDYSQLLMYIDNRLLNEKSNIFTSNIIKNYDLQRVISTKMASRIWNTSQIVQFKGRDKRK